jgi:hypothetical protein
MSPWEVIGAITLITIGFFIGFSCCLHDFSTGKNYIDKNGSKRIRRADTE